MRIISRTYRLPDGRISEWNLLGGHRTVAVLALTPTSEVVLVRQFRPGPGLVLDEMPGGVVDGDESPAIAAARELLEETGYIGDVSIVANTWLSSSAVTRRYLAVATDCTKVQDPNPQGDEFCLPVLTSIDHFRVQLRAGRLTDVDLGYLALDHLGLL
jgi:ADP-ribose pyrophosphatase